MCVCVCVRERERETEGLGRGAGEQSKNVCVFVCEVKTHRQDATLGVKIHPFLSPLNFVQDYMCASKRCMTAQVYFNSGCEPV